MTDLHIMNFNKIRFCYDEVCAVEGVNFFIQKNTLTAFVGPNGGGKSTLLKIAAGLLKPDKGDVEFEDGLNVGYVAQNHKIDFSFPITVREIVLSGTLDDKIKPFSKYNSIQKEKANSALLKVGLQDFGARGINQLSGGQLKRALIARALASDAKIIVLDEPDSSLDIDAAKKLYEILYNLKAEKTILMASHNVDNVLSIADTAIYINKTAEIYSNPTELEEKLKEGILI
jgi:zinc transport system ATP-binding protein